jgi:hypothetical protein
VERFVKGLEIHVSIEVWDDSTGIVFVRCVRESADGRLTKGQPFGSSLERSELSQLLGARLLEIVDNWLEEE